MSLQNVRRQIRNLQRNMMECFAMVTFEFEDSDRKRSKKLERLRVNDIFFSILRTVQLKQRIDKSIDLT